MKGIYKILLIFIGICIIHTLLAYHPVIFASFDDGKYVDGEVFTPANGVYDFRKFSLNSPNTHNYTTMIDCSGFAQFVDDNWTYTINVFEWDKMTGARRERMNSSFQQELEKPHRQIGNVTVYEGVFLNDTFYSAYVTDEKTNTQIYIATPSAAETVEIINSIRFIGG